MAELAIFTKDLTKDFKGRLAVDSVDLAVPRGMIYGLLGPNGAGKTTTMHLLLGLLNPTRGTSTVLGFDSVRQGHEVRSRCGVLLEHHGLYERLTALQNLEYHARINRLSEADRVTRCKAALDSIGLWERRDELVGTWSKGMKQKLGIARALLHDPEVVFLDEPTAGHDPAAAKELRETLTRLVREKGMTMLMATHNLAEAEAVCGLIGILQNGRLISQQSPEEMRTRARQTRLLIHATGFKTALVEKIRRFPNVSDVVQSNGTLEMVLHPGAAAAPIVRLLVDAGANVEEVRKEKATLEEAYLQLTKAVPQ